VVRRRFAERGIAPERLDLWAFSDEATMLRAYQHIDIVLDPFPYNGCNTTCDALCMGVPVVTLEGRNLSGRHGVAILTTCGLQDWITYSTDEYVRRACAAAGDLSSLSTLRADLRNRFLESPLCDGPGFARAAESLYYRLWEEWCR
jgi:protein O-GlcNAc transferase